MFDESLFKYLVLYPLLHSISHNISNMKLFSSPIKFLFLLLPALLISCGGDSVESLAHLESYSTDDSEEAKNNIGSAGQMKDAALSLLSGLDNKLRTQASYSFDDDSSRTKWSNLPAMFVERDGAHVRDLSSEQRMLLHDLIRASTSSQGYQKIAGIMWLDDILSEQSESRVATARDPEFFRKLVDSWSTDNYWFVFHGSPSTDSSWAWSLHGHHMASIFTVVGEKVGFTPMFLGAEPFIVKEGPFAGWKVLSHEVERGFELVSSLNELQHKQAVLSNVIPRDIFEGPGNRGSLESFEGIKANELNEAQQQQLFYLINEYVRNADHDTAERQLKRIKADGLNTLHFTWIGPSDDIKKRFYYRVHGPSILIEYMRERGVGEDAEAANHVHSIVRDPSNDYGEDWLGKHYEEHDHRN